MHDVCIIIIIISYECDSTKLIHSIWYTINTQELNNFIEKDCFTIKVTNASVNYEYATDTQSIYTKFSS